MLWGLVCLLIILWLLGLVGSVGGDLIHLLLVLAIVVGIYNLFVGRRPVD